MATEPAAKTTRSRKAATKPDEAPSTPAPTLSDNERHQRILRELRRPFPPEAVNWKIQANPKSPDKSALCVAFIDSRLVSERLNAVCPDEWEDTYHGIAHSGDEAKAVRCRLKVAGMVREDVGLLPPGVDEVRIKGGYSDAFKRAAVKFGIGVSIYAVPQQWIGSGEGLKSWPKGDGYGYALTPQALQVLQQRYAAWLQQHAALFGEPLGHGITVASSGATDDAPAEGVEATPAQPAPTDEPHGPKASTDLAASFTRAVTYLAGFSGVDAEVLVAKVQEDCGYLPAATARAFLFYALAVREKAEGGAAAPGTTNG